MVFRSQYYILRTSVFKHFRPMVRLKQFRFEVRREILIGKAGAVIFHMKIPGFAFVLHHAVPIPFRILALRRPGGDSRDAPMNKDAEFRVRIPPWNRPRIQ